MYTNLLIAMNDPTPSATTTTTSNQPKTRRKSRSGSVSSSTTTVKRSTSLNSRASGNIPPSLPSHSNNDAIKSSTKTTTSRRRSSVAFAATETFSGLKDGIGSVNRWSQSTASSRSSSKNQHRGKLSLNGIGRPASPSESSLPPPLRSPPRPPPSPPRQSPTSSSRRRRPSSPPPHLRHKSRVLPPLDTLPILQPKVFDPTSASPAVTPSSSSGPYTPNNHSTALSDYFSIKPRAPVSNPQEGSRPGRTSSKLPTKSFLASPPRLPEAGAKPTRTIPQHGDYFQRSYDASQRGRRVPSRENNMHRATESMDALTPDDYHVGSTPPRVKDRREKDKKTMLSRALQKANTAVLLDNAQNFEGAMDAYMDACSLLQQVMDRSSGEEDRRKLEAIRVTYTNRIEELRQLDPTYTSSSGKALPNRPMSNESLDTLAPKSIFFDDNEPAVIQTAQLTRIVPDSSLLPKGKSERVAPAAPESFFTTTIREVERVIPDTEPSTFLLNPITLEHPPSRNQDRLGTSMEKTYMPPPLSPNRRDSSPDITGSRSIFGASLEVPRKGHSRKNSEESMSWLDTIDESGGSSCSSSVHSVGSHDGMRRRKHLHTRSNGTEAEFDAALDAAVEAAYDEGLEPYEADDLEMASSGGVSSTMRSDGLAKDRVRNLSREDIIASAHLRAKSLRSKEAGGELPHVRHSVDYGYGDLEADEDERMLDDLSKEYMLGGFDFNLQSKSALPRESDSSGFSGSTWDSSRSSKRTTAGQTSQSSHPSMSAKIPQAPENRPPPPPFLSQSPTAGPTSVRNRRLSGKRASQLKIDTSTNPAQGTSHTQKPSLSKEILDEAGSSEAQSSFPGLTSPPPTREAPQPTALDRALRVTPPMVPAPSPSEPTFHSSVASSLTRVPSNDQSLVPSSPSSLKGPRSAFGALKKNKSSLSLKNRALSISSPDGSDNSGTTPLSSTFSGLSARKQSNAIPPTPMFPGFSNEPLSSAGIQLFEADIHSPYSPGSPNPMAINAPIPLEPCPESYMLRPFWLMRCFYQTIAHPRGGYLSTKLFVPRDVWSVKGVKLKNVEEKVANCDLLTAALLKLSGVNTLDADAVLDEMQGLESVLEQVQGNLLKKLGSEVGTNGVSSFFKDAVNVGNNGLGPDLPDGVPPKSAGLQSKNYLTSWRKLRSKNSAIGLSGLPTSNKEVPKESLTMATLPMTSLTSIRFAKRDINQVDFSGPNASYMSSLARLFDAAQILDQIARQVEDPGLKNSNTTHVGLELSTRHACEFFGFYVCRFVLTDLTLLLEKFIKRGSEWVLV